MGGNHLGFGNDMTCAEFNFLSDPEAAYLVLTAFNSLGLNLSIFTWEACWINKLGKYLKWEDIQKSANPKFLPLFEKIIKTRFFDENDEFDRIVSIPDTGTSNLEFKNGKTIGEKYVSTGIVCDAQAMTCFLNPELILSADREFSACVELSGYMTRGQMIVHRSRCVNQPHDTKMREGLVPIEIIHEGNVPKMAELVKNVFVGPAEKKEVELEMEDRRES